MPADASETSDSAEQLEAKMRGERIDAMRLLDCATLGPHPTCSKWCSMVEGSVRPRAVTNGLPRVQSDR
jgi:hypothetical protein